MQNNLEIRHLKLVIAVAQNGTVSKAAESLHLTQSALSHQLRDVEVKLGAQLFLRTKKQMILTPAGERLLYTAEKLLAELQATENDLQQFAQSQGGVLRVSTECYTCYYWLPALLKKFNDKYPRVSVQIVVEATRRPLTALQNGQIDVAIVSSETDERKSMVKTLFSDELIAVVSPQHRFAARKYLKAEDFADQNLIVYAAPLNEMVVFQDFLNPAGIKPKQVSQIELTEAIIEMVKANLGIAVLANWAARPHIESGQLCGLPLTKKGLRRDWKAVWHKNQFAPKYLPNFVNLLADENFVKSV